MPNIYSIADNICLSLEINANINWAIQKALLLLYALCHVWNVEVAIQHSAHTWTRGHAFFATGHQPKPFSHANILVFHAGEDYNIIKKKGQWGTAALSFDIHAPTRSCLGFLSWRWAGWRTWWEPGCYSFPLSLSFLFFSCSSSCCCSIKGLCLL